MATDTTIAIKSHGGLLPADLLERIALGLGGRASAIRELDGLRPEQYHLVGEIVREAATHAWTRLTGVWKTFQDGLAKLPEKDPAVAHTREKWLLPLFSVLGYGWLERASAGGLTADDKDFPVSHIWRDMPIHLLGWNVRLDRKTAGVAGAATAAPMSLTQELLNRSDAHLWGVVSNGRRLVLLRDSTSLVRASYVDVDLEAIFNGELFNEFLLLFALLHQSRFERLAEDSGPADCWVERWRTYAMETGARALDSLRDGVVAAINRLGTGFVKHPENTALREKLRTDARYEDAFHRALLRLVYRMLFLFVAEDRDALHHWSADIVAKQRYAEYFSTARLRRAAQRRRGDRHGDRWQALRLVFDALGGELGGKGLPELGLPALGGVFEPGELDTMLDGCQLANLDLLAAVRALSIVDTGDGNRSVDYRGLDSEELGSIYESLLEYVPRHDPDERTFKLEQLSGNERKTTGSYYTPSSLIECLLDSALDPVLDDAVKDKSTAQEQEKALLAVTVCDPACGSGHFLVAAARRIAKRLAMVRTGEVEPAPEELRRALHDVVGRCIYGVDINPLAVELAKVSLWLEALEPGRPLDFLDAHIKVGNSLLGVTPKLLDEGIPDEAYKFIEGDDKKIVASLRKQNAIERSGQGDLFGSDGVRIGNLRFAQTSQKIFKASAVSLENVQIQARRYEEYRKSPELVRRLEVANAWCAAFVWRKAADAPPPVTHQTLLDLDADPEQVPWMTREEIGRLARDYRFFHWHLEFPEIFPVNGGDSVDVDLRTGWSGGFSSVLGNPPWEHIELKEQEFFAARAPRIAEAAGAKRKKLIEGLSKTDPGLAEAYQEAKRRIDDQRHIATNSGRYPLCGRGRVKTDSLFAEMGRTVIGSCGFLGMVLPTGIATDATTQYFFRDLVDTSTLVSFFDFENEAFILSHDVHHSFHFSLLTVSGHGVQIERTKFAFFIRYMRDLESRIFEMPPSEILLLNPNTGTCPLFRSRRDVEITLGVYQRVPVLIHDDGSDGNTWGVSFMQGLFNMTSDSHLFRPRDELESDGWILKGNVFYSNDECMLPLYEAKMVHHYDHRLGTYEGQTHSQANMGTLPRLTKEQKEDPEYSILPRYWVHEREVEARLAERWERDWLIGFRDICRTTDERTMICGILPRAAVGHVVGLIIPDTGFEVLPTMLSSFVFDYIARQKLGGTHITYSYLKQLPTIPPAIAFSSAPWFRDSAFVSWCSARVVELTSAAWDTASYARDLGYEGPPFVWDEGRRALLRAELDAAYFHLYGIKHDDVDYIMETFPIVKRKDEAKFGEYRTKRLILEIYDSMQHAIDTGEPYQTVLNPPPGQGPRHPTR